MSPGRPRGGIGRRALHAAVRGALRSPGVVALAVLLAARAAHGHDFWIEPSSFRPATGETVALHLRVGERFAGEAVPRSDAMLERFVAVGPAGEERIPGRDGLAPAGTLVPGQTGLYTVGYRSRSTQVEIEAGKFESYLQAEGLERISSLRAARGRSATAGRERYSRCAKALLQAGDAAPEPADAPLGFTLELVAGRNPYALAAGGELPVRLLFDGEPISGVLVTAFRREHADLPVAARTGRDGRVVLRLDEPGVWLVKAVHMVSLPPGGDAEWESWWATLTFALGGRDQPAPE